jgi:hypothetical protein
LKAIASTEYVVGFETISETMLSPFGLVIDKLKDPEITLKVILNEVRE